MGDTNIYKQFPFIGAAALCCVLNCAALAADDDVKTVAIGWTDTLEFDFVPVVLVGSSEVLDVSQGDTGKILKVATKKQGTSSLVIYGPDGKIARKYIYNAVKIELNGKALVVKRLLASVTSVIVRQEDDKIVLEGEVFSVEDRNRIEKVKGAYAEILDLTRVGKAGN